MCLLSNLPIVYNLPIFFLLFIYRKIAVITAAMTASSSATIFVFTRHCASRRAFFYADNPNYSYHSEPSVPIPELWIKKHALRFLAD